MLVIYLMSSLDCLACAIVIPFFAPYIFSLGGTESYLGYATAASSLICFLWNPIIGSLSDTMGRKRMILFSLTMLFVSNVIVTIFSSLVMIFLGRLICAFGMQYQNFLRTVLTESISSKEEQAKSINIMQATMGICFMTGALIGGFLSELENGSFYVFNFSNVAFIVNMILATTLPANKKNKESKKLSILESANDGLKKAILNLKQIEWKKYWDIFTYKGLTEFAFFLLHSSMTLILLNNFNIEGRYMGFVFVFMGIMGISTSVMMMKLNKLFYKEDDDYLKLYHAGLLFTLAFGVMGLSPVLLIYIIGMAFSSIAKGIMDATLAQTLTNKSTEKDRGSVMSASDNTGALAGIVGPLVYGTLTNYMRGQYVLLCCTLPALVSTVIVYSQNKKLKQS